jgi:hypothetical protein
MQATLMGYWLLLRSEVVQIFGRQGVAQYPFFRVLLAILLIGDLAFIFLHVLYLNNVTNNALYSIKADRGFGELYQVVKEGWISLICFLYAFQSRDRRYLVWSGLFCYVTLDDFFLVHENIGMYIATTFNIQGFLGLRGADIGELAVSAAMALIFIPLLAKSFFSGNRDFRRDSLILLGGILLFAGFAIGVDMLHIPFLDTPLSSVFTTIEDGGEMIVISFILWFVFLIVARTGLTPTRLSS